MFIFNVVDSSSIISKLRLYRMDLNFRGTKLLRIEHFRVFRIFIFADARPTILY